jgi:hypothetical protein
VAPQADSESGGEVGGEDGGEDGGEPPASAAAAAALKSWEALLKQRVAAEAAESAATLAALDKGEAKQPIK